MVLSRLAQVVIEGSSSLIISHLLFLPGVNNNLTLALQMNNIME